MTDYDVGKDIGLIAQRLNYIENTLISLLNGNHTEDRFDDLSHRLSYPLAGTQTATASSNKNLCRAVQESLYEVELLKTDDGIPSLVKSTLTRSELDDYIAKNPGKTYSEFIVSVTPSYKEFL